MFSENVTAAGEKFENIFLAVQECLIAYCGCRQVVKVFRFLLLPYSLIGTCSNVQKCTDQWT
jgi:hypothetical protein